jgi:hypothetical protein
MHTSHIGPARRAVGFNFYVRPLHVQLLMMVYLGEELFLPGSCKLLEKAQQFLKTSVNLMEIPNGNTFKS